MLAKARVRGVQEQAKALEEMQLSQNTSTKQHSVYTRLFLARASLQFTRDFSYNSVPAL